MRTLLIIALAVFAGAGCKKRSSSAATSAVPNDSGGSGVDPRNTNYQPGAGAVQNARQAAKRVVALNDLHQLGQLIEVQYNETGKMPNVAAIKANLTQSQNLLSLINDGTIILTGTSNHSGLWAYEVDADKNGGIVLVGGTASRCQKGDFASLPR